jgi:hypothetical protein
MPAPASSYAFPGAFHLEAVSTPRHELIQVSRGGMDEHFGSAIEAASADDLEWLVERLERAGGIDGARREARRMMRLEGCKWLAHLNVLAVTQVILTKDISAPQLEDR